MLDGRRLPQLSVLRAFEATVRHESVMRAAKELNLTDGAVSRSVRELEIQLGFDLFDRGHRAIRPNAAARALAQDVRGSLDDLAAAMARARRAASADRPLVISCEPTLLIRWLIPRLAALQDAVGAEREVRFVSAGGTVPFARDGIDLAIRRADFPIPGDVRAEPFLQERTGPVRRGDLLAPLDDPHAVEGVFLHSQTRPQAWSDWSRRSGVALRPGREVRFEHFYQSLQAAVAGAGVAIGPIALVADDLASGALAAPWGLQPDGTDYVLMAQKRTLDTTAFNSVLAWLTQATAGLNGMRLPA